MDISCKAEISRVDDFIGAWVGQDGFSMDSCLVRKCAESCNVVVEWYVDLNSLRDEIFQVSELRVTPNCQLLRSSGGRRFAYFVKIILGRNIFLVRHYHSGHQASQWGDTISLADPQNAGVDMGGSSLECAVRIGYCTASIVVKVRLNITTNNTPQCANKVIHLSGRSASNRVRNSLRSSRIG